jgi:predicted nucleotidyltransferase
MSLNKNINESILVFHGSDRKFDKFDTSKIGSGDGKSLGGWGIYFSTSEDVSQKYTTKNGFVGSFEIPNGPYFNLDDNIDTSLGNKIISKLRQLDVSDDDIEQLENDYLSDEYSGSVNNKGLYDWLAYILGSEKAASLFLEKLGFVGNEFTDKMDRDANNYVVFNANTIKGDIVSENISIINENKLYPTNIVNNLTKKFGDNSEDTINKLAIFGLFRQAPPFNTVKDINQLQSLDQLNELFNKWKELALTQLISTDGPLKGNKTASMSYLDAYINNIASLGNEAKPFSYRDAEKTLIDVANNKGWVKQDNVAAQTHGVEKPHDADIMFEDDNITILKAPSKAKCIMYGQGYSWCISQTSLNYYNTYRIQYGGTIYFVLNKKLSKEDNERVCVILRYSNNKYGIADKTNSGQRSGGPDVAGGGFGYVESQLPWLRGMGQYFPENPVTESEREYAEAVIIRCQHNDLGGYIIRKSKELKFNGEEVDPSDFLRDYMSSDSYITVEQFESLTEPMKVQLVEMGYELGDEMIRLLDSNVKVRYAVLRLKNKKSITLGSYTSEELNRVVINIKDKLDGVMVGNLLFYTPKEQRYELVKQILPLVKDNLDTDMVSKIIRYTPEEQRYELVKQIFPLVKDKLDGDMVYEILSHTPEEQRYELVKQIFPLVKDKLNGNIIYNLLGFTPDEQSYELVKQILPLVKDKLNGEMVSKIIRYTPEEQRYELVKQIFPLVKYKLDDSMIRHLLSYTPKEQRGELVKLMFPLVKDKLDSSMVDNLLFYTPKEQRYELAKQIIPFLKDKLDASMIYVLLSYTPEENKEEIQSLIDKYKQQVNENIVINEIVPSEVPTKTIKFSNQLNPKIWNKDELLKPEVRIAILKIIKKYIESIDKKIKFKDIVLTGSIANYNYNELSDLDIHIVVDYKNIGDNEDLLLKYFKGIKDDWSNKYKLTIYGYPVEIFIQNERTPIESAAVYSVLNNKWIQKPENDKPNFNIKEIKNIAANFINKFDDIKKDFKVNKDYTKTLSEIELIKKEISDMRKVGLDKEGEFSTENLSFKLLRNLDILNKINLFKEKLINKQLSLKEETK